MKKILVVVIIIVICVIGSIVFVLGQEPLRSAGLSIHMIPKRVADLDEDGKIIWGLSVTQANHKSPEVNYVFQNAKDLIDYFMMQPPPVWINGIWIVTTHPDAYSEEEKQLLEDVKKICKEKAIPLSICRGSELWKGGDGKSTTP